MKKQLVYSTIILLPVLWFISSAYLSHFKFTINKKTESRTGGGVFLCVALGLVGGLIIGYVTEIMTSYQYKPVR